MYININLLKIKIYLVVKFLKPLANLRNTKNTYKIIYFIQAYKNAYNIIALINIE